MLREHNRRKTMGYPEITESVEELEEGLKKARELAVFKRYKVLLLAKTNEGITREQIGKEVGSHKNTVCDWIKLYERSGLKGLMVLGEPGPDKGQRTIPPAAMKALKARLDAQGFTSYKAIHDWLVDQWELTDLKYNTVWHIVRRQMKAKLKRSRPSHQKKN